MGGVRAKGSAPRRTAELTPSLGPLRGRQAGATPPCRGPRGRQGRVLAVAWRRGAPHTHAERGHIERTPPVATETWFAKHAFWTITSTSHQHVLCLHCRHSTSCQCRELGHRDIVDTQLSTSKTLAADLPTLIVVEADCKWVWLLPTPTLNRQSVGNRRFPRGDDVNCRFKAAGFALGGT